jgi:hypothetical protein
MKNLGVLVCVLDLDPAGFVSDLQDTNKKQIKKGFLLVMYFLKVHLYHFSKIKI